MSRLIVAVVVAMTPLASLVTMLIAFPSVLLFDAL